MAQVRALLVGMPLERFIIQGYLQHFPELGLVRVRPEVWEGLRYRDVLALRLALEEQIQGYFAGISARGHEVESLQHKPPFVALVWQICLRTGVTITTNGTWRRAPASTSTRGSRASIRPSRSAIRSG